MADNGFKSNAGAIEWYQDDALTFAVSDTAGACYCIDEDGYFKIKDSSNNWAVQTWETV